MPTETLSKLYLELANVVPSDTKSARELILEAEIAGLRDQLDRATKPRPMSEAPRGDAIRMVFSARHFVMHGWEAHDLLGWLPASGGGGDQ